LRLLIWVVVYKYDVYYGEDERIISFGLWNSYVGLIRLVLVIFLFIIILIVAWIRYFNKGAIRVR